MYGVNWFEVSVLTVVFLVCFYMLWYFWKRMVVQKISLKERINAIEDEIEGLKESTGRQIEQQTRLNNRQLQDIHLAAIASDEVKRRNKLTEEELSRAYANKLKKDTARKTAKIHHTAHTPPPPPPPPKRMVPRGRRIKGHYSDDIEGIDVIDGVVVPMMVADAVLSDPEPIYQGAGGDFGGGGASFSDTEEWKSGSNNIDTSDYSSSDTSSSCDSCSCGD